MKSITKLLLSPLILLLTFVELVANCIVNFTVPILNIISVVTLIAGVFSCFNDGIQAGKSILMVSWLVSPLGFPLVSLLIIQLISSLKNRLINL